MNKCPACSKWTLEFDNYFGRFRCFNPECGWMTPSTVEQKLNLMENYSEPEEFHTIKGDPSISAKYDKINDVLLFDFGMNEKCLDFPESDGILIWKIGRYTGSINGFVFIGAKELGVDKINIGIKARIARYDEIQQFFKTHTDMTNINKTSKFLIEQVDVFIKHIDKSNEPSKMEKHLEQIINDALNIFKERYVTA